MSHKTKPYPRLSPIGRSRQVVTTHGGKKSVGTSVSKINEKLQLQMQPVHSRDAGQLVAAGAIKGQ